MTDVAARWNNWMERQTIIDGDVQYQDFEDLTAFAIRGDDALICFDQEGYFILKGTGPGPNPGAPEETVPDVIKAFSPEMEANGEEGAVVYVEPIWLAGFYETVQDRG